MFKFFLLAAASVILISCSSLEVKPHHHSHYNECVFASDNSNIEYKQMKAMLEQQRKLDQQMRERERRLDKRMRQDSLPKQRHNDQRRDYGRGHSSQQYYP